MVVDCYGGVLDYSFYGGNRQDRPANGTMRLHTEIVLRRLAALVRSIADLRDVAGSLRVVRIIFDDLTVLFFPLSTRDLLGLAVDDSSQDLQETPELALEMLKALETQSPVEALDGPSLPFLRPDTAPPVSGDVPKILSHSRLCHSSGSFGQKRSSFESGQSLVDDRRGSTLGGEQYTFQRYRGRTHPVRSQEEIDLAVLGACRMPLVQHWVMVKARVGYDTFWSHVSSLLEQGLLSEVVDGSKVLYGITEKGLEFLLGPRKSS
jgi:predicted transcriptional regulator